MSRWLVLGILALLATPTWAQEDATRAKLDKARANFAAEIEKLRKEVSEQFDKREKAVREAGNRQQLNQLKAERQAFNDKGDLPSWTALDHILLHVNRRAALMAAFEDAIRAYTRMKEDDKAAAIVKDRDALKTSAYVVMCWKHFVNGKGGGKIKLLSDMTCETLDPKATPGKSTWFYNGNLMTLRWARPDAPGGFFVDTVRVSKDARAYAGTNQLRDVTVTGQRAPAVAVDD